MQLTDAIRLYMRDHETFAYLFEGQRHDTGSVAGYLRATVEFALNNPDTKSYARNYWKKSEGIRLKSYLSSCSYFVSFFS